MSQIQLTLTFATAAMAAGFLSQVGPALDAAGGQVSATPPAQPLQQAAPAAAAAGSLFTAQAGAAPAATGLFGAQAGQPASILSQPVPGTPLDFQRDIYPRLKEFATKNEAKFAQLMQGWGLASVDQIAGLGESNWRQHILPHLV